MWMLVRWVCLCYCTVHVNMCSKLAVYIQLPEIDILSHMHPDKHTHGHTGTHLTHTHTLTNTQIHKHTHTHTQTHTHTHTDTNTQHPGVLPKKKQKTDVSQLSHTNR